MAVPGPIIFIVAGEPSGDMLGGRLMAALKHETGGAVRFAGVGGDHMAGEGLDSLFPMRELSVMGYLEVVPKIPRLLARIRQTADAVLALRPDMVITIDSPDFSFRVAGRLAGAGIPLVHYVAPQVWAHRAGRAAKLAGILDHVLALLPFEPPYFEAAGLPCSFVGHPIIEEGADRGDGPGFRVRHGIAPDAPVLCVLAGSRQGEVSRLLPVYGPTIARLADTFAGLRVVVPTVAAVADDVASAARQWRGNPVVVVGRSDKYDAFAAANVALAASGTVVLELALAGVPSVIAYRVNPLTHLLALCMVKVRYASLVNLIRDAPVMPEFLQGACRPDRLADAVGRLFDDTGARAAQVAEARAAVATLGDLDDPPSQRAAKAVLALLDKAGRA